MKTVRNIVLCLLFVYVFDIYGSLRLVQDSTLEALELYEQVEPVADQEISEIIQDAEESLDELNSNESHVAFDYDPEQYFVEKSEVQARILEHEILEYTLDEILVRAREYPGYYGDSDVQEITDWYEQAKQYVEGQKEIFDHIKHDAKKYPLEKILEHAQKKSSYKGLISYQKIVDVYYQINPEKMLAAQKAFAAAVKFLHIDDHEDHALCQEALCVFLAAYRKLPTSLQETIEIETIYGHPCMHGKKIKSAKVLVDCVIAHASDFEDCKELIALLKT